MLIYEKINRVNNIKTNKNYMKKKHNNHEGRAPEIFESSGLYVLASTLSTFELCNLIENDKKQS